MAQVPIPEEAPNQRQFDFKKLLYQFDRAWQDGTPPRIEDLLPLAPDCEFRKKLLELLIQIDLGYRWRQAPHAIVNQTSSIPPRPRLEDYVAIYPEMGTIEQLSLQLIGEEYWARVRWGDRPDHEQFVARFPRYGAK